MYSEQAATPITGFVGQARIIQGVTYMQTKTIFSWQFLAISEGKAGDTFYCLAISCKSLDSFYRSTVPLESKP